MTIDELERTTLVKTLVDELGEGSAATLMKTIIPDGTDSLATKVDFVELRVAIDSAIARQTRTLLLTMAAFMVPIWVPLYISLLG